MRLSLAHPNEVDGLWPTLRDGFTKALEHGPRDYSPGQVWQICRSGGAFLCLAHTDKDILMASVWQFRSHEERFTFHCIGLYGKDLKRWAQPASDFLKQMARENGATRMTFCGREGWARLFNAKPNGEYYEVDL